MKRIAVSSPWPACGLGTFCLWLTVVGPAAAQDAAQLQADLEKSKAVIQQLKVELEQTRAMVQTLQAELSRLKRQAVDDADVRARLERVIAAQAGKLPDGRPLPKPDDRPPKVEGVIRAIQGDMIEISLGSDDGLKKGHRLDIYRIVGDAPLYVGRMELVKTAATASVGKMMWKKAVAQKGDHVTTKL